MRGDNAGDNAGDQGGNHAGDRAEALRAVQARLQSCRLCLEAGYDIFPRAIFSGGLPARIMLIGQAPGITEKEAGRPFNAGSGKRLFQWLSSAGIEESWFRSTQYMCSVTRCYPGRARGGSGDRVPSRTEQQLCRPYLEAELKLIEPALILPVGRLAIQLFYPANLPLEKIIGTEKQLKGRWIVPLPHPSGASRWHQSEDNRRRVQEGIALVKSHFDQIFG
jgi:uracil-DNA glycosylase